MASSKPMLAEELSPSAAVPGPAACGRGRLTTARRGGQVLAALLLLFGASAIGCGADESGASTATQDAADSSDRDAYHGDATLPDAGSDSSAGGVADTDATSPDDLWTGPDVDLGDALTEADGAGDAEPGEPPWDDPEACHPEGAFTSLALDCARWEAALPNSAGALFWGAATTDERVLVAWTDGTAIYGATVDPSGATRGTLEHTPSGAVSGLDVLPGPDGFAVFYSVGAHAADAPEDVVTQVVSVGPDATLGAVTELTSNLELRSGGVLTVDGYRLWGSGRSELDGTELAMLLTVEADGTFRAVHSIRAMASFAFFTLHAHGSQLHAPFVSPGDAPEVSYYVQSVYLAGCGLPTLPVLSIGSGEALVATHFVTLEAVWAMSAPGDCPTGSGTVLFHRTDSKATESAPLPHAPTPLARFGRSADDTLLLVDYASGALTATRIDPATRAVSVDRFVTDPVPAPTALRVGRLAETWTAATADATGLTVRSLCTPSP